VITETSTGQTPTYKPRATPQLHAFEARYRTHEEPWRYAQRAAEVLRHEWIAEIACRLTPGRSLDLGCSLGQLTRRLDGVSAELYAVDIAPTAVRLAKLRLDAITAEIRFLAASSTQLPFADEWFDLVLACDGLFSWDLTASERASAASEIHRVVRVGGHALFTEHTRPERFEEFIGTIFDAGFTVLSVQYLYDRPWYQFESWFSSMRDLGIARQVLRSKRLARALQEIGRAFGPSASRHVCVLATRQ
jgi:SAM-dependent methyltransferase